MPGRPQSIGEERLPVRGRGSRAPTNGLAGFPRFIDARIYITEAAYRHMQGCFGPDGKMATALTAFTPNTPWASMGCTRVVNFGAGTSAATPQAAAAAALWLQQATVPADAEPWQRVEAVRHALFASANLPTEASRQYFGNGFIRANAALDVSFRSDLARTPPDAIAFPWIRLIGGLETPVPDGQDLMFEVEALQIFMQSKNLSDIAGDADPLEDSLGPADKRRIISGLRDSHSASQALRQHLDQLL